jgi:Protein of unknown function (DUF2478)
MLGYVVAAGRVVDALLADVARSLQAEGWRVAGAVQVNEDHARPGRACHMDLDVLDGAHRIRISQDLGGLARGCRLDASGLETAVGLVAAALLAGPDLLVVNKFGKQEVDGRGFRPLIGQALALGIPVLTSVKPDNLAGFAAFADGLGQALAPDPGILRDWFAGQV